MSRTCWDCPATRGCSRSSPRSGRLRAARDRTGTITAAALYRELIDQWLEYEYQRLNRPGSAPGPAKTDIFAAVTHLALRLWQTIEAGLGVDDLGAAADLLIQLSPGKDDHLMLDRGEAALMLGSSTLLVRDGEGRFTFVHRSVLEWLVAKHVADQLKASVEAPAEEDPLRQEMSGLMTDFVCTLAGPACITGWAQRALGDPQTTENALRVLRHLRVDITKRASLAGQDLRGQDLSGQILRGADLRGTDLTDARLVGTDLTRADLTGATLVRANLDRSRLHDAILRDADLTGARLLGAHLTGANLTGARLHRAALLGALGVGDALASMDAFGAAPPESNPPVPQFGSGAGPRCAALDPRGELLASGCIDGTVRIWDPHTGTQLRQLTGHTDGVLSVAWSPDGGQLATASSGTTARIWDPHTGTQLRQLTGHTDGVLSVAWSPDGTHLATTSDDNTARIWNPHTGTQLRQLTGHTNAVRSVAWSPDGSQLATTSYDHTARIWDPHTGTQLRQLTGHTNGVWWVAWSPDGTHLATTSDDHTARIWDPHTGTQLRQLTGHTNAVLSVAWSPDGSQLATTSYDNTARIWDPHTGTQLRQLTGHTNGVRSVAWSPDGSHLATTSDDGTIRIWDPATDGPATAVLIPLADGGYAVLLDGLKYKLAGTPNGEFWYAVNLCRFEPGELDEYVDGLERIPADTPLW